MRYYIADLHFFHGALNTHMDRRGFEDAQQMNQYMVKKWNEKVRPKDEVVILGDLSWGTPKETAALLEQLQGKLFLIQGNHDRFLKRNSADTGRFVWIKPYAELSDNNRKVVLCHYPIMCYNGQYRLSSKGNPKTYMLYGHVHDTRDQRLIEQFQRITRQTMFTDVLGNERFIPCNMINCFCMYSDYEPWSLDEWLLYYEKKEGFTPPPAPSESEH